MIMKAIYILLPAVLLVGCASTKSESPKAGFVKSESAERGGVTFSGGDGSSYEQAVVIKGAKNEEAGVAAEHAWLKQRYPGYVETKQSLMSSNDRDYDLIEIITEQGNKSIYFDITDFFGKFGV